MKVSIITVTYNSENTIEDTIKSVINQTYDNIEYIIIDGGSRDGTLRIISKYEDRIAKVISEPDNGIYDAMNKGIKLASGDVVGLINSDDFYASRDIIDLVIKKFREKEVDTVYGDLIYIDFDNPDKVVRYWKAGRFRRGIFREGWHPPHPTFFVKRKIYEKYGFFRTELKIAADYELMLRFLEKYEVSTYYIPKVMVKMRVGGKSNRNLVNILRANYECYKAWRLNGMAPPPMLIFNKVLRKVPQFFIREK